MTILSQLNAPPIYLICGGIIAFVAILCVIFLIRAWRAGIALGMDKTKMKRAITASATFSLLPSVGILLHYETQVAQAAAEQVGMGTLSAAKMTPGSFATIALLMSICIMWGMVLSIFFNKKYTQKLTVKENKAGGGFGDVAMTAMFIGLVSAYMGSYIGGFVSGNGLFTFSGDWTPIAVAAVSALVMAGFVYLAEQKKKAWVESFSVAGSMIVGMAAAVVIGLLVK